MKLTAGGLSSHQLLNRGGRVQILGLKPNTPIVSAVEQLAFILERLHVKIVIKIDLNYDEVVEALKKSSIGPRVSVFLQLRPNWSLQSVSCI